MEPYTFTEAKALLRQHKMVITKGDDYRVNFIGGRETTAYYTGDIVDAVHTGIAMRERQERANG